MILLPGLGPRANNSRRISTIIATAILAQCMHMAVREFYLLMNIFVEYDERVEVGGKAS
jgi:hypothetical protein